MIIWVVDSVVTSGSRRSRFTRIDIWDVNWGGKRKPARITTMRATRKVVINTRFRRNSGAARSRREIYTELFLENSRI